jgi:hypothetical protein
MKVDLSFLIGATFPEGFKLNALRESAKPVKGKAVIAKGVVPEMDALPALLEKGVGTIDVTYSHEFYKELSTVNSDLFPKPLKVSSVAELQKELRFISFANENSRYHREVLSCMEVYDSAGSVLIECNEKISFERMDELKERFIKGEYIAYRYSEHKIIVLVNLRPVGEDFVRRFMVNAGITNNLIKELKSSPFINIISKLEAKRDILIVDEPERLEKIYKDNHVRLIIIGDAMTAEYRSALVAVKKYDPYARFMLANKINPANVPKFLLEAELNYARDNWL